MSISPRESRHGELRHSFHRRFANLSQTSRYISANAVSCYGVSLTTRYFAVLEMPLVKTVTKAGPKGKSVTDREMKLVSDQPRAGLTRRKTTWPLSRLRNDAAN